MKFLCFVCWKFQNKDTEIVFEQEPDNFKPLVGEGSWINTNINWNFIKFARVNHKNSEVKTSTQISAEDVK